MTDTSIAQHKAKHLLAHVLASAGARLWPGVAHGESGETPTGFYADFALPGPPHEQDLSSLTDLMAQQLYTVHTFRALSLGRREALDLFGHQPWKRHQVEVMAELEGRIDGFELDGYFDLCDCILKDPRELKAIHPEKFLLSHWQPSLWSHRGRDEWYTRVVGEIFPTPPPCACCRLD